jgi:hypothetical protein
VAEEREADRLGADAAGAVQDGERTIPEFIPDQAVEHGRLPLHRRPPVGEDEVVAIRKPVVERTDLVTHA